VEPGSAEDVFKLGQQQGAHDRLEVAIGPSVEDLRRGGLVELYSGD
jgi:hypothetical protein